MFFLQHIPGIFKMFIVTAPTVMGPLGNTCVFVWVSVAKLTLPRVFLEVYNATGTLTAHFKHFNWNQNRLCFLNAAELPFFQNKTKSVSTCERSLVVQPGFPSPVNHTVFIHLRVSPQLSFISIYKEFIVLFSGTSFLVSWFFHVCIYPSNPHSACSVTAQTGSLETRVTRCETE